MDIGALFIEGLGLVLQPETLLYLIFGIVMGIIGGALPGFHHQYNCDNVADDVVVPTHAALVFCTGVYCGCMYGDSIPAILFSVPGTPGAGATALDGHPLSQQGKADIAFGLSAGSSLLGGIIAAVCAIF